LHYGHRRPGAGGVVQAARRDRAAPELDLPRRYDPRNVFADVDADPPVAFDRIVRLDLGDSVHTGAVPDARARMPADRPWRAAVRAGSLIWHDDSAISRGPIRVPAWQERNRWKVFDPHGAEPIRQNP